MANPQGNLAHLRPPWKPGQSGNTSGLPGQVLRFARYIAEQTNDGKELCDLLLESVRDPDAFAKRQVADPELDGHERWRSLSPKERADLRRWGVNGLLDRFLGRAVQTIKIDKEAPASKYDTSKLTAEQLRALTDALAAMGA